MIFNRVLTNDLWSSISCMPWKIALTVPFHKLIFEIGTVWFVQFFNCPKKWPGFRTSCISWPWNKAITVSFHCWSHVSFQVKCNRKWGFVVKVCQRDATRAPLPSGQFHRPLCDDQLALKNKGLRHGKLINWGRPSHTQPFVRRPLLVVRTPSLAKWWSSLVFGDFRVIPAPTRGLD